MSGAHRAVGAVVATALVALASPARASDTCDVTKRGSTQVCSFSYSDGNGPESRTLRLRIPTSAPANPPIVFYLHGAPGGDYECDNSGWPEKCDAVGCILACPEGGLVIPGGHSWNSLYPSTNPDDVEFIRQMIAAFESELAVDPARIFVTGFSAGGWMTHRVGYELSDRVAVISTIASSLYERDIGKSIALPDTVAPISVITLGGSADGEVFYCGETNSVVTVASQDETFAYWAGHQGNQCASISPSGSLCSSSHGTHEPGGTETSIDEQHAAQCMNDVEVQFYRLEGGDHRYYGATSLVTPPGDANAPYNAELDAQTGTTGVDVLWNFFAAHPKAPGGNGGGGGGESGSGGGTGVGGATAAGGASGAHGTTSGASSTASSTSGSSVGGGASHGATGDPVSAGHCGCVAAGATDGGESPTWPWIFGLALGVGARRRRSVPPPRQARGARP